MALDVVASAWSGAEQSGEGGGAELPRKAIRRAPEDASLGGARGASPRPCWRLRCGSAPARSRSFRRRGAGSSGAGIPVLPLPVVAGSCRGSVPGSRRAPPDEGGSAGPQGWEIT